MSLQLWGSARTTRHNNIIWAVYFAIGHTKRERPYHVAREVQPASLPWTRYVVVAWGWSYEGGLGIIDCQGFGADFICTTAAYSSRNSISRWHA